MAKTSLRQPAGVPVGGQWRASAHDDPGTDALIGLPPLEGDVYDSLHRLVGIRASKMGVDPDDLFQDSALSYLRSRKRRIIAVANGETVEPITNTDGYLQQIVSNTAQAAVTGCDRSEDRRAYGEWRQECAAARQLLGRPLTSTEQDELAEEVSNKCAPRRRPSIDFHRKTATNAHASLDRRRSDRDGGPSATVGELLPQPENTDDDSEFPEGSAGAQAQDLITQGGRPNHARAKSMAWDAVAEPANAPVAAKDTISEQAATRIRGAVRTAGGASALVSQWRDESISETDAEALFSPFGSNLSYEERADVADVIERYREWGDSLWDGAVTGATKRRKSAA